MRWSTMSSSSSSSQSVIRLVFSTYLLFVAVVSVQSAGSVSGPLFFDVYEEQPIGTEIGNVARASSGADTSRPRYSLRPLSPHFHLDPRTGLLRTAAILDRETLCPYESVCELLSDVIVSPLDQYQLYKIVVRVHDINDHAPVFPDMPQQQLVLGITESAPPGTRFSLPVADDYDSEPLAVVGYRLEPPHALDGLFRLDVFTMPDGSQQVSLELLRRLDRETESNYEASLVAVDGGNPPRSASLRMRIHVTDVNDNAPRFEHFPSGSGSLQDSENDAELMSLSASLPENPPVGLIILRVSAVDPDEGVNGQVMYRFSEATEQAYGSMLEIDPYSGSISVRGSIDYERDPVIQLTIVASDMAANPLSSLAHVTLRVQDVNDFAPTIVVDVPDTASGSGHVTEGAPGGTFVARVAIYDADSGLGGQVTCSVGGDRMFRLAHVAGGEYRLQTAMEATFDRELVADHRVSVTCRDRGSPSLSSSAVIHVVVDDVNDNEPRLSQDRYVIEIPENNFRSTEIGQLSADDNDEGLNGVVAFRLESLEEDDVTNAVEVDPTSGLLTTNVEFDYERRRMYSYVVVVVDGGRPARSSSALLDVIVVDRNDERPDFRSAVYRFAVAENLPAGTFVGNVEAYDADVTPDFRRLEFRLEEPSSLLDVDASTGEVRTLRPLDHEEATSISVRILVSDLPSDSEEYSPSICDVIVDVLDENDNDPVILFPAEANETIYVDEDRVPPAVDGDEARLSRVIKVDAVDADEGPEANLTYFIADDGNGGGSQFGFGIDPLTGWIAVSSTAARQRRTSGGVDADSPETVELTVGVTDNGTPPRTTFGRLTLHVSGLTAGGTGQDNVRYVEVRTLQLTWTHRLVLVIGSSVGVAVMVASVFLVVMRRRKVKWGRSYNCRQNEANVIVANGGCGGGGVTSSVKQTSTSTAGKRSKKDGRNGTTTAKKGVTFNLAVDVDDEDRDKVDENTGRHISSPLREIGRYCTISECAFHRHSPSHQSADMMTSSLPSVNHYTPDPTSSRLLLPCHHHRHHDQHNQRHHFNHNLVADQSFPAAPGPGAPMYVAPPRVCGRSPCRISPVNGLRVCQQQQMQPLHTSMPPKYLVGCQQHPGVPSTSSPATSPSYAVGRCSTFAFSRSQGSLTDSGQGHSDPDDVTPGPFGRPRFTYNLPTESEV